MLNRNEVDDLDVAVTTVRTSEQCVDFVKNRAPEIVRMLRETVSEIEELESEINNIEEYVEIDADEVTKIADDLEEMVDAPMLERTELRKILQRLRDAL